MTTPRPISEISRRTALRTDGGSGPVAAPASAAPATTWTIRSTSWEGTPGGTRNDSGNYEMHFEIAVPAGTTIEAPRATLQFGQLGFGIQVRAGDGTAGERWDTARHDELFNEWGTFVYTGGAEIVGPATVNLAVHLDGLTFPSPGTIGTITFTSDTPADGPTIAFSVLRTNTNDALGYITSPAG